MMGELVELAQSSADASSFELRALELLQQRVGCDVAFFSTRGAQEQPTTLGLSEEICARAVQRGALYFDELLPVKRAALAARGVAVDTQVLGEQRVRRTAYFNELARSVGPRHAQLMAYVPLRGQIVAALMLGRASGGFSESDIRAVEALLPELGVARGSYGLPVAFEPLPVPERPALQRGLDAVRGYTLHEERQFGGMTVRVRDRAGYREMVAARGAEELVWTRAGLSDPGESGWPYVELLHLAAVRARARTRALFIGCGGAVAPRQFARGYPGIQLELVEREAAVVELARRWYELDAIPQLSVHVADGCAFLQRAPASRWDVVVVDAFDSSEKSSAWGAPDVVASLWRALRPGGAVAINVIGTLDGRGPVQQLTEALRASFEAPRVVPVMQAAETYAPGALRNVVLVASRSA
jgi:spermidine synthase